ncbi:MAG: hypothetical protein WCT99_04975 [Bacteroidota bacterium]
MSTSIKNIGIATLAIIGLHCSLKENQIVDPTHDTLVITSAAVTPDAVVTDSLAVSSNDEVTFSTIVRVSLNKKDLGITVRADIESPLNQTVIATAMLHDDGILPDITAGDGAYAGLIAVTINSNFFGELNANITAESPASTAPMQQIPILIRRKNSNPVLTDVQMPDSIQLGVSTQTFEITCTASDSDGLSDILKIQFKSYRLPDTLANKEPIEMFDDGGSNGAAGNTDRTANDGIYTLSVQLPPSTIKATYRFVFQGFDATKAESNILTHEIVVH